MKRTACLLVVLHFFVLAWSQTMTVYYKNGNTQSFNMADIESIDFPQGVLIGWSQTASVSQQINIKYNNGNSVQIDAKDVDYIEFKETESNPSTPSQPDTPTQPDTPVNPNPGNNDNNGNGDMAGNYLTFVAEETGTFKFSGTEGNDYISYSLDNGNTWNTLASNTNSPTVTSGNKIMWKGTMTPSASSPYGPYGIGTFSSTNRFSVEGNIHSLLWGDNFQGHTSLTGKNYTFYNLFCDCTGMTSAENLVLPATTLVEWCYYGMFDGCTSLTTAPGLPATTLAESCYEGMFYYCKRLTTAPALPATTLAYNCYFIMFAYCKSLTTAPELPARNLAQYCYWSMFSECSSLQRVPELPAIKLARGCYRDMFQGCTSLNYIKCFATDISAFDCTSGWVSGVSSSGTFVKASNMSSWETGEDGIPSGWTVQNE